MENNDTNQHWITSIGTALAQLAPTVAVTAIIGLVLAFLAKMLAPRIENIAIKWLETRKAEAEKKTAEINLEKALENQKAGYTAIITGLESRIISLEAEVAENRAEILEISKKYDQLQNEYMSMLKTLADQTKLVRSLDSQISK